jgi:hypothetical protein
MRAGITGLIAATVGLVSLIFSPASVNGAECVAVVNTNQPQSQSVLENCPAIFSVGVTGTGPYSYQWFRDGEAVPGATNSSYTIPHVLRPDSGTRIYVTIRNECSQATSSDAFVYVLQDVVPPRLLRARGDASLERVIVTFAVGGCDGYPGLDIGSAQDPQNYSFSGRLTVLNALLEPNGTNVILTTTRQIPQTVDTLRVGGVADRYGNVIPMGSETQVQFWFLAGTGAEVVPPPVSLMRSGSDILIARPYGSFLQWSSDVGGPWHTVPNAFFFHRITADSPARFFRALFDP